MPKDEEVGDVGGECFGSPTTRSVTAAPQAAAPSRTLLWKSCMRHFPGEQEASIACLHGAGTRVWSLSQQHFVSRQDGYCDSTHV